MGKRYEGKTRRVVQGKCLIPEAEIKSMLFYFFTIHAAYKMKSIERVAKHVLSNETWGIVNNEKCTQRKMLFHRGTGKRLFDIYEDVHYHDEWSFHPPKSQNVSPTAETVHSTSAWCHLFSALASSFPSFGVNYLLHLCVCVCVCVCCLLYTSRCV